MARLRQLSKYADHQEATFFYRSHLSLRDHRNGRERKIALMYPALHPARVGLFFARDSESDDRPGREMKIDRDNNGSRILVA